MDPSLGLAGHSQRKPAKAQALLHPLPHRGCHRRAGWCGREGLEVNGVPVALIQPGKLGLGPSAMGRKSTRLLSQGPG